MKKLVMAVSALLVATLFCACNFTPLVKESGSEKRSRSSSRAIDSTAYTDVTLSTVNAELIKKADFALVSTGTFRNGSSSVTVDFSKGRVTLYTPSCQAQGDFYGKSLSAEYVYEVKAASSDCLYICPSTRYGVKVNCGGEEYTGLDFPQFALYIPLYGFGASRLEVSSILNGEIGIPSGTYWKE